MRAEGEHVGREQRARADCNHPTIRDVALLLLLLPLLQLLVLMMLLLLEWRC